MPHTLEPFLALETQVWNALVGGDIGADRSLLAEDFIGVYPSGVAGRDDHAGQLANGPTIDSFEILAPRLLVIDDNAVLLAYLAAFRRAGLAAEPEQMYVSSLWCRRGERWLNVFSQDTPAP